MQKADIDAAGKAAVSRIFDQAEIAFTVVLFVLLQASERVVGRIIIYHNDRRDSFLLPQ